MTKLSTRMCLSCRQRAKKEELLRFFWRDGKLTKDLKGNDGGRGVYLHDQESCLRKMPDVGRWKRALRLNESSVLTTAEITAAVANKS